MNADDPRHGTVRGYIAHGRSGVPRCDACRTAWRRYDKRLKAVGPFTVSTLGSQRRIRALHRLGWSRLDIAQACGYQDGSALKSIMGHPTMSATTAAKVAAAYERMSMRQGSGPKADWWRRRAEAAGWPPPLAWDDIDRDLEPRGTGYRPVLARDATEMAAEIAHLRSLGVSMHQAARQLGVSVAAIEKAIERAKGSAA